MPFIREKARIFLILFLKKLKTSFRILLSRNTETPFSIRFYPNSLNIISKKYKQGISIFYNFDTKFICLVVEEKVKYISIKNNIDT